MLVNSIPFWIFFLVLLVLYWWASTNKTATWQNILLLIASYYFYAQASWKMCILLAVSTITFYVLGTLIEKYNHKREQVASWLTNIGVCLGVGLLVYFKFLDFLIYEFAAFFNHIGLHNNMSSFGIIMPLGISFFTFKLISYVVEVHRERIPASRSIVDFGVFVAFFPTIMSGPIDRPNQFLPQLQNVRKFSNDNVSEGLKHILWGMFLKMCIADQLSKYTDAVLNNYTHHNATSIILASILYSFQMYTDFCGYSDMAIGVGQIMGIKIRENFNRPFWAQNVAEYWRRWHMSLTTWLTDYVFMPLNLAFRNIGQLGLYLATILNLIIVGFWHGSKWTYGLFGLYHGLLLVIVTATEKKRKKFEKEHGLKHKTWWKYCRIFLTFIFVTFGMLIFQSSGLKSFRGIMLALGAGFGKPTLAGVPYLTFISALVFILIVLFKEWKDENKKDIHLLHSSSRPIYLITSILLLFAILFLGNFGSNQFIYFKF